MSAVPDLAALWNSRDAAVIAAAYAQDAVRIEYAIPEIRLEGRGEIEAHVGSYVHAIPDCSLEVRRAFGTPAGHSAVEWTFRGTHVADLPGIPARGEPVVLEGVSILTTRDGLITEERLYWDAATLLAAAGVLG